MVMINDSGKMATNISAQGNQVSLDFMVDQSDYDGDWHDI